MDEDISIIDSNTRNEKIKNFLTNNKKKIISSVLILAGESAQIITVLEFPPRAFIKIFVKFDFDAIFQPEWLKSITDMVAILKFKMATEDTLEKNGTLFF